MQFITQFSPIFYFTFVKLSYIKIISDQKTMFCKNIIKFYLTNMYILNALFNNKVLYNEHTK